MTFQLALNGHARSKRFCVQQNRMAQSLRFQQVHEQPTLMVSHFKQMPTDLAQPLVRAAVHAVVCGDSLPVERCEVDDGMVG